MRVVLTDYHSAQETEKPDVPESSELKWGYSQERVTPVRGISYQVQ